MVKVIPSVFECKGKTGDFEYMIQSGKYENALFIFNENKEWYSKSFPSSGNACIRHYNQFGSCKIPKSAGVITGTFKDKGFKRLDKKTKKIIDKSIDNIIKLIEKYNYETVYYSAEDSTGKLGTSIFVVADDVIEYITDRLKGLENV